MVEVSLSDSAPAGRTVERGLLIKNGGRGGIRTHDTVLPHTRFPSVRLQPLGHPSGAADNAQGDPVMQPLGSPPN